MNRHEMDTVPIQLPFPIQPQAKLTAKPFLKWAGGKSGILKKLFEVFPTNFGTYYEPFLGSGAVFFEMSSRYPQKRAVINDINPQLIQTYKAIKKDPDGVVKWLRQLREQHTSEQFKLVRESLSKTKGIKLAAYFIYLNKTCYNGLYRVNSKGQFNVPMGSYENPQMFNEENIRAVSKALMKAKISNVNYRTASKKATENDLIYFDPPYDPISKTASFTAYTKEGFVSSQQEDLARYCKELHGNGIKFVVSNSKTQNIETFYSGFRIETLDVRRLISCDGESRVPVSEVLVMNFDSKFQLLPPVS